MRLIDSCFFCLFLLFPTGKSHLMFYLVIIIQLFLDVRTVRNIKLGNLLLSVNYCLPSMSGSVSIKSKLFLPITFPSSKHIFNETSPPHFNF